MGFRKSYEVVGATTEDGEAFCAHHAKVGDLDSHPVFLDSADDLICETCQEKLAA